MRTAFLILALSISAAGQAAADLVLLNGNIRTLGKETPRVEALAVKNGRIVALGNSSEIRKLAAAGTKVIDVGGKLVIPGFNDSHVHFTGIGNQFSHLDLRSAPGRDEVLRKVRYYAEFLPKGRWILGGRFDLSQKDLVPTLKQFDAASPDNPVLLYSPDYRTALANSSAMTLAGLSSESGIFDGDAVVRIRRSVPQGHERNWSEIAETASSYAASLGVTSVQDVHSDDLVAVLRDLDSKGRLKTRVYECIGIGERHNAIKAKLTAATGDAMVRTGCIKGQSDGSVEEAAELTRHIAEADKAGLQVMIHAIGRSAIGNTLGAFEAVSEENGRRDRRFRVEHGPRLATADIARLSRNSVIVSMQPHLFDRGGGSFGDNYKGLLAAGTLIAFGSDASITDLDPLLGIYAAVDSGANSITVEQAVRAYTLGSAYAEFQEREKGTLEVGKLADMVILSEDIFSIPPRRIPFARVVTTIVGGNVVYKAVPD
ncbi:MAG: amidohydrolase [Pyrinomonadaceae bacterium]